MVFYALMLSSHNVLRWLVLAAAMALIVVAASNLGGSRAFAPVGRRVSGIYVGLMNIQFLLGALLLFTSPIVKVALADFRTAMKTHELRFFTVEHTTLMILALALAHVGAARSRKAPTAQAAYRRMLVWGGFSVAALAFAVPWWRPLLRTFAGA